MPDSHGSGSSRSSRARYLLGLASLGGVIFLWLGSSFLMSALFHHSADPEDGPSYDKPFAVTYINTATFTLYLLPACWGQRSERRGGYDRLRNGVEELALPADEPRSITQCGHTRAPFNVRTTAGLVKLSGAFCVLWFAANWSMNASLKYTDVGIVTVLSSLSGIFTLLFGVMTKVESLNWRKVIAVILSLLGVAMISGLDSNISLGQSGDANSKAWIGDVLALLGAALYGLYTTLLKAAVPDETELDEKTFLGYVGLLNIICLSPFFAVLHWSGIEHFSIPRSGTTWLMIGTNAFLGTCLADYLWLKALILTTPLLVTLGLSISIPLAVVGDTIIGPDTANEKIGPQYLMGALAIFASFFLINSLENLRTAKDHAEDGTPSEEG